MNGRFKLIAHRGNMSGPSERENEPSYLIEAINKGFDVEVDVWYHHDTDHRIMLGHDGPQYPTTLEFLKHPAIWAHAKNPEALEFLLANDIHCFWHQTDYYTLTSKGFIWTFPNKQLLKNSVYVDLNKRPIIMSEVACGACCDYLDHITPEMRGFKK